MKNTHSAPLCQNIIQQNTSSIGEIRKVVMSTIIKAIGKMCFLVLLWACPSISTKLYAQFIASQADINAYIGIAKRGPFAFSIRGFIFVN